MTTVRSSRASSRAGALLALTIAVATSAHVSAHRRDESLQAARFAIELASVQIELDLTPGIALADAIISEIDRNHDGSLSVEEQQTYGRLVIETVDVAVDGHRLGVDLDTVSFPDNDAMRRGEGTIRVRLAGTVPAQAAGAHQLTFRNRHHADRSVYLANALVPRTDRIAITAQHRDGDQRDLTLDYVVEPPPAFTSTWLLSGVALVAVLATLLMRPSRSSADNQR